MAEPRQETDLVLPYGVHAFILDITKGNVNVYVGPMKTPLSAQQEVPVVLDSGRYRQVSKDEAIKTNITARKGEYVILRNPEKSGAWPKLQTQSTPQADNLLMGQTVNIPGPVSFAPWPMQEAEVVAGHHLKSNQYLLVRVYDEEAARTNWNAAKLVAAAPVAGSTPAAETESQTTELKSETKVLRIDPSTLTIGQQLVIRGTEVSFFIPPTGIEVVKDVGNGANSYVREALSLERLEYCLLVDEDGNKRYVRGPEVVFPSPTETFKVNDENSRKSRAYELNEISGLHVKVIQSYREEIPAGDPRLEILKDRIVVEGEKNYATYAEGDELFITGKEQALYFPRVEHALLKYEGRTRYHAIAIPPGEARYVMNRLSGEFRLERGPSMFLPDPRTEVIVQRILTPAECRRYYPGNEQVLAYNSALDQKNLDPDISALMASNVSGGYKTGHLETTQLRGAMYAASSSRAMDAIDRGGTFTPPRKLVLNSKFEGAVQISPYTGYAIQIVNKKGDRRVVVGPTTELLEYDERLETLLLSTGKPKTSDRTIEAVYLRIANNSVSDVIDVKTKDLVPFRIQLKYLVRFLDAHKDKWFSIDNYVQHLVDHFRSMLSNFAKGYDAKEFYANGSNLLRDRILGPKPEGDARTGKRPLTTFEENGMQVYDLDVIGIEIMDNEIRAAMQKLQNDRLTFGIQAERMEAELLLTQRRSDVERDIKMTQLSTATEIAVATEEEARKQLAARHATTKVSADLRVIELNLARERDMLAANNEFVVAEARAKNEESVATITNRVVTLTTEAQRIAWSFTTEEADATFKREIDRMIAEAKSDVDRIGAISPQLTGALASLAATGSLSLVAKHLGNLAIVRGISLGGVVEQMFGGTQFEGLLKNLDKIGNGALVEQGK